MSLSRMYLSGGGAKIESSGETARLPKMYVKSKEFQGVEEHLNAQLKSALNEPQAETPEFATNFPWQVIKT